MSKFTKESPFVFMGRQYCRSAAGNILVRNGGPWLTVQGTTGYEIVAFIEAERNEWHWTNADKAEARKGRWSMILTDSNGESNTYSAEWTLAHADFSDTCWHPGDPHRMDVGAVFQSFLDWSNAQQQPEEPTGLGAVVEVEGRKYVRNVKAHDHDDEYWRYTNGLFFSWSELTQRGPVTVLSTGVES
ncbi:hypothetical protein [Demequina globuliformis]|uniref:hypothetical protein n=1 Tax=Demequina globuliformis TaxID=676202 RepID=UPI000783FC37|nr:hypothetical protein [Demequina globuliformis]